MRKQLRWAVAGVVVAGIGYAVWCRSGRGAAEYPLSASVEKVLSVGRDTGNGNLVGIQPYMAPADYAYARRFRAKLDAYLRVAREHDFLTPKAVVIFPEYLGAWLVAAHEKASVYGAPTAKQALTRMAISNPLSFLRWFVSARAADRATNAAFKMKADTMAAIYHETFSELAKQYGVTLVAGSTVLPSPTTEGGVLRAGRGQLFNVSVVYGPDGKAMSPAIAKAFPIREEREFLSGGRVRDLPVFDTPAGRLGVLICADSWQPAAYEMLKRQGAEIIAVPSYLFPDGAWRRNWYGYEAPAPPGVDEADMGRISEGEAWVKYALPGRIAEAGARAGMVVFLGGKLWDLGADGQTIAVQGDEVKAGPEVSGAAIVNLWLGRPERP
jgi:predicted amidohydrolase